MSQSSDSDHFDCTGDANGSSFVAPAKVVPVLTRLLAEGKAEAAVHLYEHTHEAAELRIYALFTRALAERLRRAHPRSQHFL
jgi:hypothetical protein